MSPDRSDLTQWRRANARFAIWLFVSGFMLCFLVGALNEKYKIVQPATDYIHHYLPVAERILEGQGPTTSDGRLATRYPPVYPYVLAACIGTGRSFGITTQLSVLFLQCFAFGTCCSVLFLTTVLFFGRRIAVVAASMTMSYPFLLYAALINGTEVVFTSILLLVVYILSPFASSSSQTPPPYLRAVSIGILTGLITLIRPIALLLGPVFLIFILFQPQPHFRRRLLAGVLLLAGYATVLAPWESAAYRQHGKIIPISTAGAAALRDAWTYGVAPEKGRAEFTLTDEERLVMLDLKRRYSDLTSTSAFVHAMLDNLTSHPLGVITLTGRKLLRAWYGTESGRLDNVIGVINLLYGMLLILGLRSYIHGAAYPRRYLTVVLIIVLPFWFMTFSALSIVRYMVPVIPLLLVIAALPVQSFTCRTLIRRQKRINA